MKTNEQLQELMRRRPSSEKPAPFEKVLAVKAGCFWPMLVEWNPDYDDGSWLTEEGSSYAIDYWWPIKHLIEPLPGGE